jgi:hypothetical protein
MSSGSSAPSGPGLMSVVGGAVGGAMNRKRKQQNAAAWARTKKILIGAFYWGLDVPEEEKASKFAPHLARLTTKHRRIVLGTLAPILIVLFLMR